MDNLMSLMFGITCNNHDADLVGRDQVDDYTIDTCLTADLWEDWPFAVDDYGIDDIGDIDEVYFTD